MMDPTKRGSKLIMENLLANSGREYPYGELTDQNKNI